MTAPIEATAAHSPESVGPAPTGRQVRRLTKMATEVHSGGKLGELLNDIYNVVFSIIIGITVAIGVVSYMNATLRTSQGFASLDPSWLAIVVTLLVVGMAIGLAARLGPLGVGVGHATWWLPMPVDRRGLLRPRLIIVAVVSTAVGAVLGAFVGVLGHGIAALGPTAALGAAAVAALTGLVALGQTLGKGRRRHPAILLGDTLVLIAPVLALVTVLVSPKPVALPSGPVVLVAAAVFAVVAVLAWVFTDRRADRISGVDLRARGAATAYVQGATSSLDTRELGRALSAATTPDRRRRSASMAWVKGPVAAIATGDLQVFLRAPRHVLQVIVSALVPLTASMAGWPTWAVLICVLFGGLLAASATGEGSRLAEMAPVLDRLWPLSDKEVRRARMILPVTITTLWTLVVLTTIGLIDGHGFAWVLLAIVAGPIFGLGTVRAAYRKPVDWSKPLVSNPFGPPIPPGLLAGLSTGPDVVILGLLPTWLAIMAFGPNSIILFLQLACTFIVFGIVSRTGGETMMERAAKMTEQNEKMKREVAAEKAERAAAKRVRQGLPPVAARPTTTPPPERNIDNDEARAARGTGGSKSAKKKKR